MQKFTILMLLCVLFACTNSNKTKLKKNNAAQSVDIKNVKKDTSALSAVINDSIKLANNLKSFIPKGYTTLEIADGDLNLDAISDKILVLASDEEESETNENSLMRPLLILLGKTDGTYALAHRNENAVYAFVPKLLSDDPFVGITIKKGYFSINYEVQGGQHWNKVVTFKYNVAKKNWFLDKDHYQNYELNDSTDPDAEALVLNMDKLETPKNFGVISFNSFNANK